MPKQARRLHHNYAEAGETPAPQGTLEALPFQGCRRASAILRTFDRATALFAKEWGYFYQATLEALLRWGFRGEFLLVAPPSNVGVYDFQCFRQAKASRTVQLRSASQSRVKRIRAWADSSRSSRNVP